VGSRQSVLEEKVALRRLMRERREALGPDERARRSAEAAARLEALPEMAGARVVAAFAPKGSEIAPGFGSKDIVFPRATDGAPRLRFHRVPSAADLRPGAFGVNEPDAATPEVAADAIDVFVVPGLAFDHEGHRLGYGGGYYDELIAHVRSRAGRGLFVGLGFDFQLVERCPAGVGDAAVDLVVTDARVVRP
jgi:5-formyltetrahydrofolate cyclo-ligase